MLKPRHEIDESVLIPKVKKVVASAAVVAILAVSGSVGVGTAHAATSHDRKMLHDGW